MDRLWAGWRSAYMEAVTGEAGEAFGKSEAGASLFEQIYSSGEPDEVTHILWHGETCFAILNAYPYGSGHLMVLPKNAVANLEDLAADTYSELFEGVRQAVVAIKAAYQPDGVNVGANLGRGAGAGVPDHLHIHCLPRWIADSNFVTAIAETRVLPESLDTTWLKLRNAWKP